jgi:hypothetical protein
MAQVAHLSYTAMRKRGILVQANPLTPVPRGWEGIRAIMRSICARLDKRRHLSSFAFTPSAAMGVEVFFCPSHGGRAQCAPTDTEGFVV